MAIHPVYGTPMVDIKPTAEINKIRMARRSRCGQAVYSPRVQRMKIRDAFVFGVVFGSALASLMWSVFR